MAQWTDEQLEAITGRDRQMLVSAAAGSGKTSVLVERIIRRVTDPAAPVDVDRLLVVTFTNGAAAEMRERIGRAVSAALERQPGAQHLLRQQALLQRASISTIHSFCLDVVRQHCYRLALDPLFRVMDETEAAMLQLDVLEEVLEEYYAAEDADFLRLADCYGGSKDDGGVQELVLQLYKFSRSTPEPEAWLAKLPSAFDLPAEPAVDHLPWFRVLINSVGHEIAAAHSMTDLAVGLASRPGGPAPYLAALEKDKALLEELAASCAAGWEALYQAFGSLSFAGLARCRKDEADEDLILAVKKTRDLMKKKLQGLQSKYFHRPPAELLADLRSLTGPAQTLTELVGHFAAGYRQAKLERAVVDFSDLEHYALAVLTAPDIAGGANANSANGADVNGAVAARPSPVALELRQRYAEVLVDEYQDINAVQETILSLLTGGDAGPSLFMVGDVKQSIYRFRLAEPGLFLAKYNLFSTSSGAGRLVNLARNFRSRRQVVEGVNYVFRLLMTRTVGEMEYDRRAELAYGAGYASLPEESDAVVELLLLDNTPDQAAAGREEAADGAAEQQMEQQMEQQADEPAEESADELGEEAEEELDSLQREARAVARRIIELVESGHPVSDRTGGCRPVTYRDVAVLMRAVAGRANIFMEEFRRLGVPAYAELSTGYFEATEVETMLALLKVIDNPRQDVPLAAVLTSAAGGFSADDLARIRVAGGSGDFYDALAKTAQSGDELLARRVASFLRRLDGWRTAARQKALPELIWALYRESGYYDYVGGLPGGSQRQANLRALYQRAGQFESTAYRGLFRFLRFIERLRRSEGDMGTARALGESENVVRIMSIHKSKGLEFPVVLVAGLGKKFNLANLNRNVLLHRDMGLGLQLVDPVRRLSYPTVAKLAVREKMRFEALAEEMRLLYVAMTRAKEKLILVGSVAKLKEAAVRWCAALEAEGARLPDWLTARAANYLDWLGPALARHQDGEPLRELAGLENSGRCPAGLSGAGTAESRWLVRLSGGGFSPVLTAGLEEEYRRAVFKMQPVQLSGPRRQEVEDRLSWVYPQQRSHLLAARTTITALQRLAHAGEEKENPREVFRAAGAMRPAFIQRRAGLSQADRGTALHLVMQLLNLSGDLSAAGVQSQMALMMEREQLLPEQGAAVDPEAVAGFFRSPLGRRVLAGRLVYREQPFTLALPLEEVYPHNGEADSGTGGADGAADTVLVQGIIDCLVEEAGGLLVVDYKTDYCTPETIPRLVERYRYQITLYSRAAETLTGRPVTGRYLYLFYLGEYVEVEIV